MLQKQPKNPDFLALIVWLGHQFFWASDCIDCRLSPVISSFRSCVAYFRIVMNIKVTLSWALETAVVGISEHFTIEGIHF